VVTDKTRVAEVYDYDFCNPRKLLAYTFAKWVAYTWKKVVAMRKCPESPFRWLPTRVPATATEQGVVFGPVFLVLVIVIVY
jgi:hypothetical protein